MAAERAAPSPSPLVPTSAFRSGSESSSDHGGSVIQCAPLHVSRPEDPAEREATDAARSVMGMSVPTTSTQAVRSDVIQRSREPGAAADSGGRIQASVAGGEPLPKSVRAFMEPRFGADFSSVRIHADANASALSRTLSARAFTTGRHIFFGAGQYQPETASGRELIAHELAHTVQQGAAPRTLVQRSIALTLTPQPPGTVQRWGISDALSSFSGLANQIPGFRMFTLILGVNPITDQPVERSAANILRAVVEFMPGGAQVTEALDKYGIFERVGSWVERQVAGLGLTGASIRAALMRFLNSLGWSDILGLGSLWERARRIFSEPIDRIKTFVGALASEVLQFVKDAVLTPLARLAQGTRGWDLLCAVLGRNPITGEAVPRNAETLIGGFMKLIGQEEVWQNIQRGNAIPRAWAWFQGALAGLTAFVRELPALFMQTLRSFAIADLLQLPSAFARVAGAFGDFAGRFFSWAGEQVLTLLQIIIEVVAPSVMTYIRRAGAALRTIIENPARFLGHLVRAGLLGLNQFKDRFLTHLQASLVGWLTGAMGGANVYIPRGLSLPEILKFALSVLGLTWQNVRTKLVRAIGAPAVAALEGGFALVMTLRDEGPAAAWEKILESIGNLRDMVIGQVMNFVRTTIVTAAITRLVTSLNPIGGFIQAIIGMYNTFMFFRERLSQIAQVAAAVIDAISAIANGVIGAAANRVEQTMAGLLTLVISFLARIAGLGSISERVIEIINRIRQPIDRALDRVVTWLVERSRALVSRLLGGSPNAPAQDRLQRGLSEATRAVNGLSGSRVGIALIRPLLAVIRTRHNMRSLEAQEQGGRWAVVGEVNPRGSNLTSKLVETGTGVTNSTFRSRVTFQSVNPEGFGQSMVADPIGPDKNDGTTVSDGLRMHLRGRIDARQGRYRLGHLLNHNIGGPGNDWRNLTPITQSANSLHSSRVERAVKALVAVRRWVRYRVTVLYGGGPAVGPNEHPLERRFATALRWSYQLLKADPNDPTRLVNDTQPVGSILASGGDDVPSISAGYP